MSDKSVCLNCKKSFSKVNIIKQQINLVCPQCGEKIFVVNQKFKPPKKTDKKEWQIIKALIDGGYNFQSFYQEIYPNNNFVSFPKKLSEVEPFLEAYRNRLQ